MSKITTFSEYSRAAASTQMESCKNEDYLRFGLISEVGELCAIFKRAIRGDFKLEDKRQDILLELGDICGYLDRLADFEHCHDKKDWPLPKCLGTTYSWMEELAFHGSCFATPYCWNCVTILAAHFGFTIWDVLTANVDKLAKRKERGLIMGSGDHR